MTIMSKTYENTHTYEYWNIPLETKICALKIIFQCERCHNIAFGIIEGKYHKPSRLGASESV